MIWPSLFNKWNKQGDGKELNDEKNEQTSGESLANQNVLKEKKSRGEGFYKNWCMRNGVYEKRASIRFFTCLNNNIGKGKEDENASFLSFVNHLFTICEKISNKLFKVGNFWVRIVRNS